MKRTLVIVLILLMPIVAHSQSGETVELYPLLADGGLGGGTVFGTVFFVTNVNDGATMCTLAFTGLPDDRLEQDEATFTLNSQGEFAFLSTVREGLFLTGYATLTCDGPVSSQALYEFSSPQGLLGLTTVFSAPASSVASIPLILGGEGSSLALSVANDSDESIGVDIQLLGDMGLMVDTASVQIPARSTFAGFLSDLMTIPFEDGEFGGAVIISSLDGSFHAMGLLFNGTLFTSLPANTLAP